MGSSRISSSGRCWSAMTRPIFCLLPLESSLNLRLGSMSRRSIERRLVGGVDAAAEVREVLDRLAAGQAVVERELARDVADPAVDRRPGRRSSRCRTRTRDPEVGRMRSSSVRIVVVLPAPLGPRKPKISFSATSRSTSMMPRCGAVRLGQALGADDAGHAVLPCAGTWHARRCRRSPPAAASRCGDVLLDERREHLLHERDEVVELLDAGSRSAAAGPPRRRCRARRSRHPVVDRRPRRRPGCASRRAGC